MNFRVSMAVIGLFVLFSVAVWVMLRPATSPVTIPIPQKSQQSQESKQSLDIRVQFLYLEMFEMARGASVSCELCPDYVIHAVSWIKSWPCVARACDEGGDKKPTDCSFHLDFFKEEQKELGDKLFCNLVQSPGKETRQALINAFVPGSTEDSLVEGMAYLYAFKGNVAACQMEIKNYLGPYGPAWSVKWYEDMSGCRILAQERTRHDEEKDFSAWLRGTCSDIINAEMRAACNTPDAPLPDRTLEK